MAKKYAFTIVAVGAAAVLLLGLLRWETMLVQYHLWRVRNDPEVLSDLIQTDNRIALKALDRFFGTEVGTQALAEHFYDRLLRIVNNELNTDYPAQLKLNHGIEFSLSFKFPTDHRFSWYWVGSMGAGSRSVTLFERTPELSRTLRFASHLPRIGWYPISPTVGISINVDESEFWCLITRRALPNARVD